MPLPTTVTTAKQTAAKAAQTRKINTQAQTPSNTITPKLKTANTPNLDPAQVSQEILQYFHNLGMGRDEIRACAGQWLVTQAEVQQWEAKLDAADQAERERIDLETAKAAAQINACILQHGHVRTPAIKIATPSKLLDYIDYYEAELDDLYPHIHDEHHTDWAENNRGWNRLNTYLWECKVMAGLTPVTLQVLTNQNLEATLDQALEEAKPETRGVPRDGQQRLMDARGTPTAHEHAEDGRGMNQAGEEREPNWEELRRRLAGSAQTFADTLARMGEAVSRIAAAISDLDGLRPPHQTRTKTVESEPAGTPARYCQRPGCGEEIPRVTSKGKALKPAQYASRTYCSQRCSGLVSGQVRRAKAAPTRELDAAESPDASPVPPVASPEAATKGRYTRYCQACGKAIDRVSAHGRRYYPSEYARKRFCSRECVAKAHSIEPTTEIRHCVECGKPIAQLSNYGKYYSAKVYEGMKYCSRRCAGAARRKASPLGAELAELPPVEQREPLDGAVRRRRLEAAKAVRRGAQPAIDADAVLAALGGSPQPLTARGVLAGVTGRINDGELEVVKRLLGELVTAGLVARSRSPGNQVVFGVVARGVEATA